MQENSEKLGPMWKCRKVSVNIRMLIANTILRSKLMYGLETCRITDQVKKQDRRIPDPAHPKDVQPQACLL